MTVTSVERDPAALTMTVHAEFDAPPAKVWDLWADPRKLERWWGPPTYPATFVDHDLTPGASCSYYMTGPEGDQPHGWWRIIVVEAPHRLQFEDGFADEAGDPNPDLPVMTLTVTLDARDGGGTHMTIENRFASAEAMEQVLSMGAEEGMREAMSQMDSLLG